MHVALVLVMVGMMSAVSIASAEIPSEVKIGGIFDKNWAEGDEGSRMAEIAIHDINEHLESIGADWRISITIEDAQSQSSVALEKVQTLNSVGIDMLVGMAFSAHISLAASYIDTNDILVLSHASQATILAMDDSIFRLVPNDGQQAPAIAEMLEDAGIKVLITVVRGDTWGDGLVEGVEEAFDGTTISGFRYNPDVNEFSVEVSLLDELIAAQIEEHGADAVGVLYVGTDEFLSIIQNMRFYENVYDVRWFGSNSQSAKTYFFDDPLSAKFSEETRFTATRSVPSVDNDIKDYLDAKYMELYDAPASTYGYAAYDSVWLLATAILETQSTDTNVLTEAIPRVAANMHGASGSLALTEYGDLATSNFEVLEVIDGIWVPVSDVAASEVTIQESATVEQEASVMGVLSDGTDIMIKATEPTAGDAMRIDVMFVDREHINYDIVVMQEDIEVLNDLNVHHHEGAGTHMTETLASDAPVDINIIFRGYGIDEITGPIGDEIVFVHVVPEFDMIATLILAISIVFIVAVSARSKLSIMAHMGNDGHGLVQKIKPGHCCKSD